MSGFYSTRSRDGYRLRRHASNLPLYTPLSGIFARYWRIYITANNGDGQHTAIGEVEFRSSPGGADLTTPATPTNQSSFYPARAGDKTVDNSLADGTSAWTTAVGAAVPSWVSYDLGSILEVAQIAIWRDSEVTYGAIRAPKNFLIQNSPDNSAWTTVKTVVEETGWVAGTAKTYIIP